MTDAAAPRYRVVVCDDVADYRTLLVSVLEITGGMDVVGEAAHGGEAITMALALKPDAMLLDIAMPVMDGIEALPLIRQASPDTRVVVLTGFASDEVRDRVMAAGAAAYVEKGTRPAGIVKALRIACAGKAVS